MMRGPCGDEIIGQVHNVVTLKGNEEIGKGGLELFS
jgi:hypothetical protein